MTTEPAAADEKLMRLRYAGVCHLCGRALPAGELAVYERIARRVRCVTCPAENPKQQTQNAPAWSAPLDQIRTAPAYLRHAHAESPELDEGTAGASARLEYQRRRDNREQRIRTKHPKLGGLILALSEEPQSTRAWERGAIGE